jgi:hypothetical protein
MATRSPAAAAATGQHPHALSGSSELLCDATEAAAWETVSHHHHHHHAHTPPHTQDESSHSLARAIKSRTLTLPGSLFRPHHPSHQLQEALPDVAAKLRRVEALEQSVQQKLVRKRRLSTLHMLGPSMVRVC